MDTLIDLWYLPTDQPLAAEVAGRCRELLTAAELRQEQRFLREEHRRQYLLTRALVRTVLGRYGGVHPATIEFVRNNHGKPRVAVPLDFSWQFNLSHTQGLVVCAVTREGNLGVDVEPMDRRVNLQLADRYFASLEVEALERLAPTLRPPRFLHYWTLKESFIKALGTGLATPLDDFAFDWDDGDSAPRIQLLDPQLGSPDRWYFHQFTILDRYWGAVAVETPLQRGKLARAATIRIRPADLESWLMELC
jgi:4'-phosphopantetheinyl transferase